MKTFSYSWSAYGYGEIEAETKEEAEEKIYDMQDALWKDAENFSVDYLDQEKPIES